jgi:PTS hybrid protein
MTGIVVVSHSRALAEAAVDLAHQMVRTDAPTIEIAAGVHDPATDQLGLGTDAVAISAAIETADDGQGVVVLMDLGSAILSARTALEFTEPEVVERTRLSWAPLVEGLIGATVSAASGADPAEVADQAEIAAEAKRQQLAD